MHRTFRASLLSLRKSDPIASGRRAGLSLLEIAIVVALLTAVAMGTALLLVPIARQARISRETEVANAEAQKVLERIHATPFTEVLDTYPQDTEISLSGLPSGNVRVSYDDPAADPLVIRVALAWESPELGSMQLFFDTVRTE